MPDDYSDALDAAFGTPRKKLAPLDLINKYESPQGNVPNYRFDPGHTAQGFYQITNTNWRNIGPQVGVDLKQYPSAMAAPKEVQAQVAGEMYRRRGFADWAPFNPRLKAAINRGEADTTQNPATTAAIVVNNDDPYKGALDAAFQQPSQPAPRPAPQSMRRFGVSQQPPPGPFSGVTGGVSRMRGPIQPRMAGAQVGGEAQVAPSRAEQIQAAGRMAARSMSLPAEAGDVITEQAARAASGLLGTASGGIKALGRGATLGIPTQAGEQATATIRRPLNQLAGQLNQAANEIAQGRGETSQALQNLGGGAVASSPAMVLTALGVPAPVAFGVDSYLKAEGRDADWKQVLKETGLGVASGALFELPTPVKTGLLGQIAQKFAIAGIPTYGMERLAGASPSQALTGAGVQGIFNTLGARSKLGAPEVEAPAGTTQVPDIEGTLAAREAAVQPPLSARNIPQLRSQLKTRAERMANARIQPEEVQTVSPEAVQGNGAGTVDVQGNGHHSNFQNRNQAGEFTEGFKPQVEALPPLSAKNIPDLRTQLRARAEELQARRETATPTESFDTRLQSPEQTTAVKPATTPEVQAATTSSEGATTAPTSEVGVAERYAKAELGEDAVIPGEGKSWQDALSSGRDQINAGVDPRSAIRRAQRTGRVGADDVGLVRAEYERLASAKRAAVDAAEANPDDFNLQQKAIGAEQAQRAWRKEMQPVLTKASDALRGAQGQAPVDLSTYSGLHDLVVDTYGGERELSPQERTLLQKTAQGVKEVNVSASDAVKKMADDVIRRSGVRKVMSLDELRTDLSTEIKGKFKNCGL